jgi:hypothetical protein
MSKKYIADVSSVYGVSEHDKKYLNNCSDNETKLWLIEQVMNGNIILSHYLSSYLDTFCRVLTLHIRLIHLLYISYS